MSIKYIAHHAYQIYLKNSQCQLSPDDAIWYATQYVQSHSNASYDQAIQDVANQLIQSD